MDRGPSATSPTSCCKELQAATNAFKNHLETILGIPELTREALVAHGVTNFTELGAITDKELLEICKNVGFLANL